MPDQRAPATPEAKEYQGHIFDRTVLLLEQNIRGVQLGIYSVAVCGLVVALRSVRPFKKFSRPDQIPVAFFRKHVSIGGEVRRLEFSPVPTLVVEHCPLLLAGMRAPGDGLKVRIASVDLAPNGVAWLQTLVVRQPVSLTLISRGSDHVSTVVHHRGKDVGQRLVGLGFASVGPFDLTLQEDALYKKYYQSLLKQEERAENAALGMWSERRPALLFTLSEWLKARLQRVAPLKKVNY